MEIRQLSFKKYQITHSVDIIANKRKLETVNLGIRYKLLNDHENVLNILPIDKLIRKISMKYGIKMKLIHIIYDRNITTISPHGLNKFTLLKKVERIEFDKEWSIIYNREQLFKTLSI